MVVERLTESFSFSKRLYLLSLPLLTDMYLCVPQHKLPLQNTQADDVGVSLSTTPSRLFQIGVIKDDMEEDEDYSNVSLNHTCRIGCHTPILNIAIQEEFEEDLEEDLNIKGNVVGDMQSSASIQLR